ncbi:MAG: hypothetical protein Q4E60_05520 [Bacteroidales bacterium]|nr:hypothetical protein [Bacteroidales bacterium]
MRKYLALFASILLTVNTYAQQDEMSRYQNEAGDFAALYQGKIESEFNPFLYTNHPFLDTDEYQAGDICYCGVVYKNVPMRYNALEQTLSVQTPQKGIKITPEQSSIEWFKLRGDLYQHDEQNGGFCATLVQKKNLVLKRIVIANVQNGIEIINDKYRNRFSILEKLVLYANGKETNVKKLADLYKLFPQKKKELKQFAKQHNLSFKNENRAQSMKQCVEYLGK